VPKYRRYKGTGHALVVLSGREHYLSRYGSRVSQNGYDRLIGQRLSVQRASLTTVETRGGHTVIEFIVAYLKHARKHYRKHGEPPAKTARSSTR